MARLDKFGLGALIIGIIILVAILNFVFMTPAQGGWTGTNLWNAIVVMLEGGVIWLGLILILIGLLLLFL